MDIYRQLDQFAHQIQQNKANLLQAQQQKASLLSEAAMKRELLEVAQAACSTAQSQASSLGAEVSSAEAELRLVQVGPGGTRRSLPAGHG